MAKKLNLKEIEAERVEVVPAAAERPRSQKEELLALYDTLKALGIRSISDLENLIARAE